MQRSAAPELSGGFRLVEHREMPGVRSRAIRARHHPSGADLILVQSPGDREMLFAAVFRTPPPDSSGVPHILEHCVLCGSRKFPVKDPFMELVKTSMATSINAFTCEDRTVYPCASLNRRDFFNLMDVYTDAVFNPILSRYSFLQEGHRLEPGDCRNPERTGVVFNEMRGAYADPDDYTDRLLRSVMFRGTTYGNCPGGDPERIPLLSYDSFLEYHRRHYHPSNSCLLVIADIPEDEVSGFLGERLQGFSGSVSRPAIVTDSSFEGPVYGEYPVPGPRRVKNTVISGWHTDSGEDQVESLALSLMDDVLLDGDASPLKSALVESGLGTGLAPSGYCADIALPTFTAGLRGVGDQDVQSVFEVMNSTLKNCSEHLNHHDIQGFLRRKELYLRTIGQRWAYRILEAVARAWTHGRDPLDALEGERLLASLRERLSGNPRYIESLVERYLAGNPKRLDAVFKPSPGHFRALGRRRAGEARKELRRLGREGADNLRRESDALRSHRETPDSPEALASLPSLSLSDIPAEPSCLDWEHLEKAPGLHLITVPGETNGVCHLNLSLGLAHLPAEDLPLAHLAAEMVTGTGAGHLSHQEASRMETACSGGIAAGVTAYEPLGSPGTVHPVIMLGASCLPENLPRLLDLLGRRILSPGLDNRERLSELGREVRGGIQAGFVERAGSYASVEAAAVFRPGLEVVRLLKGMEMVRETMKWTGRTPSSLSRRLVSIWEAVSGKAPLALAWTGPEGCRPMLEEFLDGLPGVRTPFRPIGYPVREPLPLRGILSDSEVSCAAGAFPGRERHDPMFEPLFILMSLLGNDPLWNLVRGKLGAYGVSAGASSGLLTFSTYRDPSPEESLGMIRSVLDDPLGALDLSGKAVRGAVFSALQGLDPLIRPSRAPFSAAAMFFTEISPQTRKRCWKRLLSIDEEMLVKAAEIVQQSVEDTCVCVAADRHTLAGLGIERPDRL